MDLHHLGAGVSGKTEYLVMIVLGQVTDCHSSSNEARGLDQPKKEARCFQSSKAAKLGSGGSASS